MRKIFNLFMIVGMALSFAACNSDEPNNSGTIELPTDVPVVNNEFEFLRNLNFTGEEAKANEGFNEFSFKFVQGIMDNYQTVCGSDANGNVAFSPLSATLCMAMMANTCDDATNQAISEALGSNDLQTLNAVCNKLLRHIPFEQKGAALMLANSVWFNNRYSLNSSYSEFMKDNFGAYVGPFDLSREKESLNLINGWCAANTKNIIPEILNKLDPELSLILINALYFNGEWGCRVDEKLTVKAPFYGVDGTETADMMQAESRTLCYVGEGFSAVALPFTNHCSYFWLVVPSDGTDIEQASKELSYAKWQELVSNSRVADVTVHFPKFSIAQDLALNAVLKSLGIKLNGVTLEKTGIEGNHRVQVRQKTSTTVNEEGVKAAAITYEIMDSANLDKNEYEQIELTFDRPFFFFIESSQSGSILMAGRVCNI